MANELNSVRDYIHVIEKELVAGNATEHKGYYSSSSAASSTPMLM